MLDKEAAVGKRDNSNEQPPGPATRDRQQTPRKGIIAQRPAKINPGKTWRDAARDKNGFASLSPRIHPLLASSDPDC
ncbi:hypothetical protein BaRGS_00022097 [Batillaria attramentaria]|uniref:Uncharacterized protein n=1 Tax=Batillaria attramentaria TaxID=370345 RepID=A0ABD0KIC2_9CAEN